MNIWQNLIQIYRILILSGAASPLFKKKIEVIE